MLGKSGTNASTCVKKEQRGSTIVFRKQEVLKKRWERMKVLCMVNGGICWRYHPLLWIFPPQTRGMWTCITVITNALGHMYQYVYNNPRSSIKIYAEISGKWL